MLHGMAHRGNVAFLTTSMAHGISEFAAGWRMVTASTPVAQPLMFAGHGMYRLLTLIPLAVGYPSLQPPSLVLFPLLL